jgi:hypothetical protein
MHFIIRNIFNMFFRPEPAVMLGRWNVSKSEAALSTVIRYANEDHCGTCVKPVKTETRVRNIKTQK